MNNGETNVVNNGETNVSSEDDDAYPDVGELLQRQGCVVVVCACVVSGPQRGVLPDGTKQS